MTSLLYSFHQDWLFASTMMIGHTMVVDNPYRKGIHEYQTFNIDTDLQGKCLKAPGASKWSPNGRAPSITTTQVDVELIRQSPLRV
jgi:hypothetical protein